MISDLAFVSFVSSSLWSQKKHTLSAQPNFLSEGVRCNARQKKCGWAVLRRTAHSHLFLLAAADVPLITRNYLVALRITTRHTSQTTILIRHVLLTALWAATLTASTILDILLEGTLNTILPSVDSLRVEV